MEEQTQEQFIEKHIENYKNAVIEIIKNNTNALIDEDIASLIKQPPLTSMDTIMSKLITLSKNSKTILDSEAVERLLSNYRKNLLLGLTELKETRNEAFINIVLSFSPTRETEIIVLDDDQILKTRKKIEKCFKKVVNNSINETITGNIASIFTKNTDEEKSKKISESFIKYLKGQYQRQLHEKLSIKILVKDKTLVNGIAEQGERYLFTKNNSYIFKEEKAIVK